jgi:teichuronic acid biosynthesis glycosyltransferase TuaG
MSEPLVSIITPAYNARKFIESTIESVALQSYRNWEHLIVIDRNSNDETLEIVRRLAEKEARIRLLTPADVSGAPANRNVALENARGEYIAFLDADDLWHSEKLAKQISFMQKHALDFTFTGFVKLSEDGTKTGVVRKVPLRVSYYDLLKNNSIACLTAVFKAEKFRDIRFQENGWEDLAFWLQILKRIPFAYAVNEPLAFYRVVRNSRSNNKLFALRLRWNTYREVEKFSLLKTLYFFLHYTVSSLLKYRSF